MPDCHVGYVAACLPARKPEDHGPAFGLQSTLEQRLCSNSVAFTRLAVASCLALLSTSDGSCQKPLWQEMFLATADV